MKSFKLHKRNLIVILLIIIVIINSSGCTKKKVDNNYQQKVIESSYYDEQIKNIDKKEEEITSVKNNQEEKSITKEEITIREENKENNQVDLHAEDTEIKEEKIKNSQVDLNNENTKAEEKNLNKEESSIKNYSKEDNIIIDEFNQVKDKVSDILNSENVNNAKDKAKGIFISIVDFIFYDGEIKGVKFSELTEGGKQKVLEIADNIDSAICKKFPNYKEDISTITKNAYLKASSLIKQGAHKISEFSKEKLGEENYQTIISAKDDLVVYSKSAAEIVGNFSSKVWNSAKEKLKNWYENFKNN